MSSQTPRYILVEGANGKKQLIASSPSQIGIKKENSAIQSRSGTEPQYIYQTIQSSSPMAETSGYNKSYIKIEKVESPATKPLPRSVSYKYPSQKRSVSSTSVASQHHSYSSQSLSSSIASQSTTTIYNKKSDKKRNEKPGKGLRHFSMRVCQKVKEKGVTSYNEVADELVAEESEDTGNSGNGSYDQKNIRRRGYDALNVLMAMNIISKEKKEIKWIGLPTSSAQECEEIELQNQQARKRIEEKQQQLRELVLKHVSFKSLIERNKDLEKRGIVPSVSAAVQLPFIVINTNKKTHINCNISNDKREYLLKFDDKFEVQDDFEVLKRMGLLLGMDKGESTPEDIEKLKMMVPKSYQKYIEMYGNGYLNEGHPDDFIIEEDWTMMDQSQSSFSQESTRYESMDNEYVEEDTIGSDDNI
ncbi:CLUMA_CG020176, isoform A [Clunio marinus]|uniref:CLUMA_CG020176, isoform A n=1 Tax=Clunio marinus TaxID=568069 RepID=A0A1J1J8F6_9DIPT|nr:CLUMA_CG020176, isoform A [Clunio marinus]